MMKFEIGKRELININKFNYNNYKDFYVIDVINSIPDEKKDYNIYFIDENENIICNINKLILFKNIKNINKLKVKELEKYNNPIITEEYSFFDIYNLMRNKYQYLPYYLKEKKELKGEIIYHNIINKFYNSFLKEKNMNAYNKNFFNLFLENYEKIIDNKNIGVIYFSVKNIYILQNLYGKQFIEKILFTISNKIKYSLRRIDLVFLKNFDFYILVFNVPSKNILNKINNRIIQSLNEFTYNEISFEYLTYNIFVPEEESNINIAIKKINYEISKIE